MTTSTPTKKNEFDGRTDEQLLDLEQWLYDCEGDGTDYYDDRMEIIEELRDRGYYDKRDKL